MGKVQEVKSNHRWFRAIVTSLERKALFSNKKTRKSTAFKELKPFRAKQDSLEQNVKLKVNK